MPELNPVIKGNGPKVAGRKRANKTQQIEPIWFQPDAAGCDMGAREIYVAVPADRDEKPVRMCSRFTLELREMAD